MIPLRDSIRAERTPVVNYALIAVTSAVFVLQLIESSELAQRGEGLVDRFGMIPIRVLHPDERIVIEGRRIGPFVVPARVIEPDGFPPWLTVLTCIFLHGGWFHFLGNMWFLHVFGDNVEDRLGRLGYLVFYLGAGVAASLAHLATNADSPVPTIGASGAIAGVMGAYMLLYPRSTVLTLVPIFIVIEIIVLPAPLFLGIWFVLQFAQGTLAITAQATTGVAWWAHIGGFVAGFIVAWFLRQYGRTAPPRVMRPGMDRRGRYSSWRPGGRGTFWPPDGGRR